MEASQVEFLMSISKYKEALALLDELKELTDEQILNRAICEAAVERNDNAVADLHILYRKSYEIPIVSYMLAMLYDKIGDMPKALFYYRQAMKYEDTHKEAKKAYDSLSHREMDQETERVIEIEPYHSPINFTNIVGMEKVKEYLRRNIIYPITHEEKFKRYNQKATMGVILYGSPGNGKTLCAKALGGEINIPMLIVEIPTVVGEYQGVTEKNIKTIFEEARALAPCLLFIDEFEILGGKRSDYAGDDRHGGSSGMKIAVNTLLNQMDGLSSNEKLFVLATTNRPWDLDMALKRSGRMEDMLYIPPPNLKERIASFQYYLKDKPHKSINLRRLGHASIGYSYSDIEKTVRKVYTEHIAKEIEKPNQKNDGVSTGELLHYTFRNKGGLEDWFLQARQEIVGKYNIQIVDGKKHQIWQSGRVELSELGQYKELIKDIQTYTSTSFGRKKQLNKIRALMPF